VPEHALAPLGEWTFPAPGFIGEVHHFFHVEVDPSTRHEPGGDGSPLEDGAIIVDVPLEEALAACRSGLVRDAKTEIALRRLAELGA
jgi:ADP-ribose pyrophosphatase